MSNQRNLWLYYNYRRRSGEMIYPFEAIYRMLGLSSSSDEEEETASSRVLSIQVAGDSQVYQQKRYPRGLLEQFTETTRKRLPESIHMGWQSKSERKELVFDVDVTDFRRFCQCERTFCSLCWLHIEGAYLVLRHLLETRLAYPRANLLWVFSGGKGFHCFVNSARVLSLSKEERERLHELTRIDPASEEGDRRLCRLIDDLTTHHTDFVRELRQHFTTAVLQRRDALSNDSLSQFCLETLRDRHRFSALAGRVETEWLRLETEKRPLKRQRLFSETTQRTESNISERKWAALVDAETGHATVSASLYIILCLFYPRIDPGPMRLDHVVKLPFSVNARTQAVSLPVRRDALLSFEPEQSALTLGELVRSVTSHGNRFPPVFNDGLRLLNEWLDQCDQ